MRTQGHGQQFDKMWSYFNTLHELSYYGYDKRAELEELKNKVLEKKPQTDYEVKDKTNLLDSITQTIVFFRKTYLEE